MTWAIPCEKDIDLRMVSVEAAVQGFQVLGQLSEGLLKFSGDQAFQAQVLSR